MSAESEGPIIIGRANTHGTVVQQGHGVQVSFHDLFVTLVGRQALSVRPEQWPAIKDVPALRFGIHRAADDQGSRIPEYVGRDIDELIRSKLRALRGHNHGGAVLLIGASTAGKSRAAYEAVLSEMPDMPVVLPRDPLHAIEALIHLTTPAAEKAVVWLDDLERYSSDSPIPSELISEAMNQSAVVVATIRTDEYMSLKGSRPRSDHAHDHARSAGQNLLDIFEPIHLERRWSDDELARARKTSDPRIIGALNYSSVYGVAEYMAAGPEMLNELESSRGIGGMPRGVAIVDAAVDLVRGGYSDIITAEDLRSLHTNYLDIAGGAILRPEPFDEALEWATAPRHGVTSFLIPQDSDGQYRVFDYLTDGEAHPNSRSIPDVTWQALLKLIEGSVGKSLRVARVAAITFERLDIAETALVRVAESGSALAQFDYSLFLSAYDRDDEATTWLERAADQGFIEACLRLGHLAEEARDFVQAERWYEKGANGGDGHSAMHLSELLRRLNRPEEAEPWTEKAKEYDEVGALVTAASIAAQLGRVDEATETLASLATASPSAANSLAILLEEAGKSDEAESWWLHAAEGGDSRASANLGLHHLSAGNYAEALKWTKRAIEEGEKEAESQVGLIYAQKGDHATAITHLLPLAESGDFRAASVLGYAYARAKRSTEALLWFEASVADNPTKVEAYAFGVHLLDIGDPSRAYELFEQARTLGHADVESRLGEAAYEMGDFEVAIRHLESADIQNDAVALCHLGCSLENIGDLAAAAESLESSAGLGHGHAACRLGGLAYPSDVSGAKAHYERAYDLGHEHVTSILERICLELGDGAGAARWRRAGRMGAPNPNARKRPPRRKRKKSRSQRKR
jgi:TPR repeat protein